MVEKFEDKYPEIHNSCFVAGSADILGDVHIGENSNVWFGTVIRGDTNRIIIGKNTNIQDLVMVHTDHNYPTIIGKDCSIAHHVVLHGCTIGNNTLIGMNATILNGAKIGNNCIIGANSLVTSNTEIPDNSLAYGNPAKVIRQLTEKEINMISENALTYKSLSNSYS